MSQGSNDGWSTREATASSVAIINLCGTLWHLRPRDNCEANGIVKITEKNREQAQIIESEFRK